MAAPSPSPTTSTGRLRLTPALLRVELLAGLVVALALIPEAISFSIIAGVDPSVGLYASFTIAVTIAIAVAAGLTLPTVGDEGTLPSSVPAFGFPDVPLNLETLQIIAPYSLTLSIVGLLESLMTARLVDDITDTSSDKDREARGQGIANVVTGFFGGMPGCAMIGQTMINVRVSGARTRISTFSAGAFLLFLILVLGPVVAKIPMTALAAVMVFVSYATFDWHSVRPATLRRMPVGETVVMVSTVAVTVATDNLALGVGVGVLVTMAVFSRRVAHLLDVQRRVAPGGERVVYTIGGELFFASNEELTDAFHHPDDPAEVIIDVSAAHVWDASAVAALDAITHKYERQGKTVELVGFNEPSEHLHARLSGRIAAGH